MLKEMPKVGDNVRYLGGEGDYCTGMTVGGTYEITHIDSGGDANFNTGEVTTWFITDKDFGKYDLVEDAQDFVKPDAVNSPNHYTRGKFETIEMIEEITAGYSDGYVAYCAGNALKYLSRAPFKHADGGIEDLRKAAKYLEFALTYLEAQETGNA